MINNREYTILRGFRFERKFIGYCIDKKQIETIIKMNPAAFKTVYHERFINNIYFDTDRFDFYYDNINGSYERIKYRIRWYGDLFQTIEKPVLELKIKHGQVGIKQAFPLVAFDFRKKFDFKDFCNIFEESNLPIDIFFKLKNLKPALVNRYKRQYFRDFSGDFRLTTDEKIEYYPTNQISFGKIVYKESQNHIIELKYDNDKDEKADKICAFLPFRMTKNSKYVNGIQLFHYVID